MGRDQHPSLVDDDVFAVEFGCENCGDTWVETYPPGVAVGPVKGRDGPCVRDTTCSEFGFACDCCEEVACPTCELSTVGIVERRPLEGEEDLTLQDLVGEGSDGV